MNRPDFGSLFIDSGAFRLFNLHVKGRDYSFFNLKKGSEFRRYCDSYAGLMKKCSGTGILFVNADVIFDPELTWMTQKYFEEEHGLCPVPVVYCCTPFRYVDRYLESGKHEMIGVGGLGYLGFNPRSASWIDRFFLHICPSSNGYRPVIKAHGFAVASWSAMVRYPWFSVDTAAWVRVAAHGMIYVPRSDDSGFRYDRPPIRINFSIRSPKRSLRDQHYLSASRPLRRMADRWLQYLGMTPEMLMGTVEENGRSDGKSRVYRIYANLQYMKNLEDTLPEWPSRLDLEAMERRSALYARGFGL